MRDNTGSCTKYRGYLNKLYNITSISAFILTLSVTSFILVSSLTVSPAYAVTGSEAIVTDQSEYMIGDTAAISGSNFDPGAVVTIDVVRVDGVVDTGVITADPSGSFIYNYYLNPNAIPDPELAYFGTLTVNARDEASALLATTTFLDNPNYLLQGCSRERGDCDDSLSGTGWADGTSPMDGWTSGNVKGWYEQEYVPYRLRINLRKSEDAKKYYIMNQHDYLRSGTYGVDGLGDFYVGSGPDSSVYPEGKLTKNCTLRAAGTGILVPTTGTPCYVSGPIYSGTDDDGDSSIDEEDVDGIDNDFDGLIDEDCQSSSNPAKQIQFVTAIKFETSEAGSSSKRWALYWKAHLATGSSSFPGSSLHAKTTATGSQDVPISDIHAPLAADLSITKTDSPDPVSAGGTITYTITVTNNGPDSVNDVQVIDTLPVEATFVSATGTNWTCSYSSGVVTCDLNNNYCSETIPPIYITVTAPSPSSQITITNTATVDGTPNDPNTGNNSASATTTVNAVPIPVTDLSITKTDAPDPVNAAGVLVYTLSVSNAGPNNATNLTVSDTLPSSVTYVSASGSGWSCGQSSGIVTCTRASLSSGGTAPLITITVNAPVDGGVISNSASVTGSQNDPNSANNSTTITTTVIAIADLSITKTDSPDPVNQGAQITYTITVSNAGPSTATGIAVTDTLPLGSTFVSAIGSGWSCSQSSGIVTCTLPSLNSGATASVITIKVTAPLQSGAISNTASVSSTVADPNSANNAASASTTVNVAANLAITKSDSPDPVTAGQNLTYTDVVTNLGPDTAYNIVINDYLPPGVTFVSANTTSGSCTQSGSTVTCNSISSIPNGGTVTVTVVIIPNEGGTLGSSSSVSSTTYDPVTSNNNKSITTGVIASSDLSITKTDSPDPVSTSGTLTYTLSVNNNGPSTASNVQVLDTLPAGVGFVSAAGTGWVCVHSAGLITCTQSSLAAGAAPNITITVTAPSEGGSITNTASVSATTSDPVPGNNSGSQGTTITASSDLSITKSDTPDPVTTNNTLTYTLSVNNSGPSTATGVTVTDVLPAGVIYGSASGTGWSCGHSAGVVTCTRSSLGVGAAPDIVITVTAPSSTGTITNTASITSGVNDPSSGNNSTSQTTTVNPPGMVGAELSIIQTDVPDPVFSGGLLTYTITVTNNGPDTATGVTVSDSLPSGSTFVSASGTGWNCTGTGTVTCTLSSSLTSGSSATVITVTVNAPAGSGLITNTTSVSANETDPNPSNNTAAENTQVNPSADLSVIKTDTPDPVPPPVGNQLTYTITVTNNGPSTATGVTMTDTLPAQVSYISKSTTQGTCTGTSSISCNIGTLANGASATITIVTQTLVADMVGNTATVSAIEHDPVAGNNSSMATTNVGDLSRLVNISTRAPVMTGDDVMIAGFIFGGILPKKLLIRARGPSLTTFGVAGAMANPTLELYSGQTLIAQNDNWQDAPNCSGGYVCEGATQIQATGLDPCSITSVGCTQESVVLITVPPGAYTAILRGVNNGTGVGIVEVFDPDTSSLPKLSNISTRGRVLTGDGVMIGGFIIGAGSGQKTVLLRARGPSLASFGVSGAMANPTIELYSGQTMIARNNDWQTTDPLCGSPAVACGNVADIQATGLDPCSVTSSGCTLDAAIHSTLPPGGYTVMLKGVNNGTGVGIVEVFDQSQ